MTLEQAKLGLNFNFVNKDGRIVFDFQIDATPKAAGETLLSGRNIQFAGSGQRALCPGPAAPPIPPLEPPSPPMPPPPMLPGMSEQTTISWGFQVDDDNFDPDSYAAALAAFLGDPFTADDITVTASPPPPPLTVTVTMNAADGAAAEAAKAKLQGLTPVQLSSLLQLPTGAVSSISEPEVTVEQITATGGTVTVTAGQSLGEVENAQTATEEAFPAYGLALLAVVGLLILCPVAICCYAKARYGSESSSWLRWKCSHSNPTVPLLYVPKDIRENMHRKLFYVEGDKSAQSAADAAADSVVLVEEGKPAEGGDNRESEGGDDREYQI